MPYAPVDQTSTTNAEVFKNCSNSGDIVCEGKYRRPYIGGLFGYLEYVAKKQGSQCPRLILENCSNSGNITVSTIGAGLSIIRVTSNTMVRFIMVIRMFIWVVLLVV